MITASIVVYHQDIEILQKTVYSFLNTPFPKKLFIIDNNESSNLKNTFPQEEVEHIKTKSNLGFGKGHNLILDRISSEYHLILNPDVEFSPDVLTKLITQLKNEPNVSFITPKIIYPDKEPQFACRKHPTFFSLLNRKLKWSKKYFYENEYRKQNLNYSFYPEFIQGCFMLFKSKELLELKGFDERYFLYMEDADLCREIENKGKKVMYFPEVQIIHHHQRGSSKSNKLFFIHTFSAIKYFLKWGFR